MYFTQDNYQCVRCCKCFNNVTLVKMYEQILLISFTNVIAGNVPRFSGQKIAK